MDDERMTAPRLLAISDLHVAQRSNRLAVAELPPHPNDWLIVAGDVGETVTQLTETLAILTERFARVLWVPGNHELWTLPGETLRGEERYRHLVEVCRRLGVITPEDPFVSFFHEGQEHVLAALFLLYDYSFRPASVPLDQALAWAMAAGVWCRDEELLAKEPFASADRWCAARCDEAERRLAEVPREKPLVLINHFPLREDLVRLFQPHFAIWCGTRRTEDWHRRFNVAAVVTGHLHVRATDWREGVRFEEVSLGYASDWQSALGLGAYLREILPGG